VWQKVVTCCDRPPRCRHPPLLSNPQAPLAERRYAHGLLTVRAAASLLLRLPFVFRWILAAADLDLVKTLRSAHNEQGSTAHAAEVSHDRIFEVPALQMDERNPGRARLSQDGVGVVKSCPSVGSREMASGPVVRAYLPQQWDFLFAASFGPPAACAERAP
jgi:hypothetical protein